MGTIKPARWGCLQSAWDSVENLPPIDFTEDEAMALFSAIDRHRQPDAGDVERVLQQVLDAIDTGRNEPLLIARDTVRNFMEDRRAAMGGQSEFDRMLESNDPRDAELATLRARVAVQDAEIARLREALAPFAREGRGLREEQDRYSFANTGLSYGDLRRAAVLLGDLGYASRPVG